MTMVLLITLLSATAIVISAIMHKTLSYIEKVEKKIREFY